MKRCLLTLGMLSWLSTYASADYLVIKLDVNRSLLGEAETKPTLSTMPMKGGVKGGVKGGLPMMGPGARFNPGGGMQPSNPMVPGKPNPKNAAAPLPPRWAYAYFELRSKPQSLFTKDQRTHFALDHPWGHHCIVSVDNIFPVFKESPAVEFARRDKALAKEGREPLKVLRLAEWALSQGLVKEFHRTMGILQKAPQIPADVKATLNAYLEVKAQLAKSPANADPAQANLIADFKNNGYQAIPTDHYLLLTNIVAQNDTPMKRRLFLLEDSYEKFYYWFALHSPKAIPPFPTHKLLVALVASGREFQNKNVAWGRVPIVGDGFVPRRDNILVLCAEHLDETYALLKKNNLSHYQSLRIGSEELLSGAVWKRIDAKQNDLNVALLQTLTLVQRATETEAERATISHGATRQLLFATDFLPRNVAMPEWLQYGLCSFFETPQGAFFPGLGIPSWSNLMDFKYHRRKKHLGAPKDVLDQVVTDAYFRKAKASSALLLLGQGRNALIEERAARDQEIARSTAWALIYYLAREDKLDTLVRLSKELKDLPRDLDLNEQLLRGCFKRAFKLTDMQVQSFADAWFAEMQNYVLPMPTRYEEVLMQSREPLNQSAEAQTDPTGKKAAP